MPKKVKLDVDRLCQAMHQARVGLRHYREERREAVRQYVGSHWSEESAPKKVPINLLSLYVSVVSRNLIAKNPRVMLTTFDRSLKPTVSVMQAWANKQIERLHLGNTIQRIVLDALFSIGIAKVCLASPGDSALSGWNQKAGEATLARVDLDDFVFDMHCRDFLEAGFIGHRYRVPLEVVREDKRFSKERKTLAATSDAYYNREGDERIGKLGRGTVSGDSEEFEDFVDLWEVYVPRHKEVYTFRDDPLDGPAIGGTGDRYEPLCVQKWIGPECGPYTMLSYGTVPGNPMPKGPIQDLIDLHEFVNNLYRKLMRQAERQKECTFVRGGATEDGDRVINTNDGEAVKVDNPENIKQVSMGAPNQQNFAMFMNAKDVFSWLAGNLDIMGGLSAQSKTATQDTMLNQNSARSIADMQDRTVHFTSQLLQGLCWFWWHDPFKVMRSTYSLPSLPEMQILRQIAPQQRQAGKYEDLEIKVDPYSLQHQTPQGRMAQILGILKEVYLPFASVAQQQGVSLDLNALFKLAGELYDQPDLATILTIREPPAVDSTQGGPPTPGMGAATTTRNYVRESRPGRTDKGNAQNLMSSLMGVNPGGAPETNGQMMPMGAG